MKTSKKKRLHYTYITPIILAVGLSACGGGGGGGGGGDGGGGGTNSSDSNDTNDSGTNTAVFKDNNVAGLSVTIGGQTQLTDNQGRFQYTPGDQARFSVGSVVLGEAIVSSVMTLTDLLPDTPVTDPALINRARFLQLLDANQNPEDGITINPSLREAAKSWTLSSFSDTSQFENEVAAFLSEISSAIPGASLPLTQDSSDHISNTQLCVRAGAYSGNYTGDEAGRFALQISALDGSVNGVAVANNETSAFTLSGSEPVSLTQSGDFVTGSTDTGANFDGSFTGPDNLEGSWSNSALGTSGQFSGDRISGSIEANYRYTGSFTGSDQGLFAFDISEDGTVTGEAYSAAEDETYPLSGTLEGGQLNATFAGNAGSLEGTLDLAAGTLSGSWTNSTEGGSGTFSGDGCSLNPMNDSPLEEDASDDSSGSDDTVTEENSLQLVGPEGTASLNIPPEQCLTYGVVTDSNLVSARAEWVSDGKTVITEDLPTLSSRTDYCPDLIDSQSTVCLKTCLLESDAVGPTTLTLSVENQQGETATEQAGEYFTNAGPFNGVWIGETVQTSNCGDDGTEGGTITILQGSETSAAVYGLTPNYLPGGISGGVLSSNSGYSTETYSGLGIDVTDWQATLVGEDVLEGSASFDGQCSGSFSFMAVRK